MKVFFDTVGCRLNQSEIECMAREFRFAGHTIVGSMNEADLVVVNTCSVTSQAASDSRQKIRQAARLSARAQIIATGCWATLEPDAAAALSEYTRVVLNDKKDELAGNFLGFDYAAMDLSLIERETLPGTRHRTRAFIKVQDGCDAFCTVCVTRIARGKSRGEPVDRILADVQSALAGGAKEIVLTGVQLGSWGKHFSEPKNLSELVRLILEEADVPRLRFSSIEPWDMDAEFFRLFDDRRICRHLHIAIQSGSAATLKRMGRRITPSEFMMLLDQARQIDDNFAITTDVIAGFPGETLAEFEESLDFIQKAAFSGGHVFPYSARQGTPAASFPDQVQSKERKIRAARVRDVLAESTKQYQLCQVGKTVQVLWEVARPQDGGYILDGFCENYVKVRAFSREKRINCIDSVHLEGVTTSAISGDICP